MFAALFVADAVRAAEVRVTGVTGAEHARAESARQHQLQVHTLYSNSNTQWIKIGAKYHL